SILHLLSDIFSIMNDELKKKHIIYTKQKLLFELDNLYKEFGYTRKKSIKKDLITSDLSNLKKVLSNETEKYIVDYFGINLYIFNYDDLDFKYVDYIVETKNPYKPTLFLKKLNDQYFPIYTKDDNLFLYSKYEILDKLYFKHVEKQKNTLKRDPKNGVEIKDSHKNIDHLIFSKIMLVCMDF
ncbi:MAG: hypothetical protein AAFQ94_31750, partial [Bacteroidota bacterium]